jgi:membrane protease YdiL (CAAX protease family)
MGAPAAETSGLPKGVHMSRARDAPYHEGALTIDRTAFETYRQPAGKASGLWRLALGTLIIVICWAMTSLLAIVGGVFLVSRWLDGQAGMPDMATFATTPTGVLTVLASFCGIWIGTWIAMRFVHRETLSVLFGNSRRISRSGFVKGLAAVFITSLLSEVLIYPLQPGIARGAIGLTAWLLALVPIAALTLVQTSSEELLFRGYLPRGLARRFSSPVVWALLPTAAFTALHWSPANSFAINICIMISIGAFAIVLMLLVYATGNLGAAFGAHLANNLTGFLLISHQESYNAFALFTARPLEGPGWTPLDAALLSLIGLVSSGLTALLLLHPRSPLKVDADRG